MLHHVGYWLGGILNFQFSNFARIKQLATETDDQYCTRLRELARECEFPNTDQEIEAQILQHCSSGLLRRQVLRNKTKEVKEVLTLARTLEAKPKPSLGHRENHR